RKPDVFHHVHVGLTPRRSPNDSWEGILPASSPFLHEIYTHGFYNSSACRSKVRGELKHQGGFVSTLSYSAIISERTLSGRQPASQATVRSKFDVRNLNFWYGTSQTLFDISLQ